MKRKNGFTIVELLAVILILGILIALLVPTINNTTKTTKEKILDTKKNTITVAAEKYGNKNINTYQKCATKENEELSRDCKIPVQDMVETLMEMGYIENDEKKSILINPITNEELKGEILLCYNKKDVTVSAIYVEEGTTENYTCSGEGIRFLSVSPKKSTLYIGGTVSAQIYSGEKVESYTYSGDQGLEVNINKETNKITVRAQNESIGEKTVTITITANYADGTSQSVEYEVETKKVEFELKEGNTNNGFVCLKVGESKEVEFEGRNYDNVNILTENVNIESILGINRVYLRGIKVGKSNINIVERNANKEITLRTNVYDINNINIPELMIKNQKERIEITKENIERISVESLTNNIRIIETNETGFTIEALENGKGTIRIKGYGLDEGIEKTCFESTYEIDVSNYTFEVPEKEITLYTDNPAYSMTINTDKQNLLYCETTNGNYVDCTVEGNKIYLTPKSIPIENVDVKVGLRGVTEEVIKVKILKVNINLVISNTKHQGTVCREISKNENDDTVTIVGDNVGNIKLKNYDNDDWCLTDITINGKNININPRQNVYASAREQGKVCSASIGDNNNTGISTISLRETNSNIDFNFQYRTYILDLRQNGAILEYTETNRKVLELGKEFEFDVEYSYTGEEKTNTNYRPIITSDDPDAVEITIGEPQIILGAQTNIANLVKTVHVKVKGIVARQTNIVVSGTACGTKTIPLSIIDKVACPTIENYSGIYDGNPHNIEIQSFGENGFAMYSENGEDYYMFPNDQTEVGTHKINVYMKGVDLYESMDCEDAYINIRNAKIEFKNTVTNGTMTGPSVLYTKLGSTKFYDGEYSYTEVSNSNLPTVEKVGYNFRGWTDSGMLGEIIIAEDGELLKDTIYVDEDGKWGITEDIKLYASAYPKTFTITYDANGGVDAPQNQEIIFDSPYQLSTTEPSRTGYTFLGWHTDPNATSALYGPGENSTRYENYTLYAVWEKSSCDGIPKYLCPDGTYQNDSNCIKPNVTNTITYTTPCNCTSSYTCSEGGRYESYYSCDYDTRSNVCVVVKRTPKVPSYGTFCTDNNPDNDDDYRLWFTYSPTVSNTCSYGSRSSSNSNATMSCPEGYTRGTITTNATCSNVSGTCSTSYVCSQTQSATCTATGTLKYYCAITDSYLDNAEDCPCKLNFTIQYNANGGTNAPVSQDITYNTPYQLSSSTPTREGHTFLGWSESSTATSSTYTQSQNMTLYKDYTLYAVWKKNYISCVDESGNAIACPSTLSVGQRIKIGDQYFRYIRTTNTSDTAHSYNECQDGGAANIACTDADSRHPLANNQLRLLAEYNLNVGSNKNASVTEGIQHESIRAYRADGGTTYGNIEYGASNNNYSESNVKTYTDNYASYLNTTYFGGNSEVSGSAITLEELVMLGCNISGGSNACSGAPNWVYTTTYWSGSPYTFIVSAVWRVDSSAALTNGGYNGGGFCGVRPVISISASYFE